MLRKLSLALGLSRHRVGFYGSCHAKALTKIFEGQRAAKILSIKPYFEMGEGDLERAVHETIPKLDCLIYQPISGAARGPDYATANLLRYLSPGAKAISFCYPHFEAYNPYSLGPAHGLPEDLAYVDYGVGFAHFSGIQQDRIWSFLNESSFFAPYADQALRRSIEEIRGREERTLPGDRPIIVKMSDWIEKNFRDRRLFLCMNHPTGETLTELARTIAQRANLHLHIPPGGFPDILGDTVVPIPAYVIKAYGLRFGGADRARMSNQDLDIRSYVEKQVAYFSRVSSGFFREAVGKTAETRPWFRPLFDALSPGGVHRRHVS